MQSKDYRLRELFGPSDGRSLIVDTSAGLSLGALAGLERFNEAVSPILPMADGIVTSPGQSRQMSGRKKTDAALLVRGDWTNALRDEGFVLPAEVIQHIPLLSPQHALDLGASALVIHFLLGYEEMIEAECLRMTVQLAIEGSKKAMPLIVDLQPLGPRVVLRSKAIELGVSFALEGGVDGVAIPWPGEESFKTVMTMAAEAPVWVKLTISDSTIEQLRNALDVGAVGPWFNEQLFAQVDPGAFLAKVWDVVHPPSTSAM